MADKFMTREDVEAAIIKRAAEDPAFLEALRKNPKAALQDELKVLHAGIVIPDNLKVSLVEESPDQIYLRLPLPKQQNLSEQELAGIVGGTGPGVQPVAAVESAMVSIHAVMDANNFSLVVTTIAVV